MNRYRFNTVRLDGVRFLPALYLPYALVATLLIGLDSDPFGIDPGRTSPLPAGEDLDPFGCDPGLTSPITSGLTPGG